MLEITFYGVRGSTPCACPSTSGIGGNTACVVVEAAETDPIILDLGTGLRYFGCELQQRYGTDASFRGTALVSHLHWDHIQGIPFFAPILQPDAELHLVGPIQTDMPLEEAIRDAISPPMFPVPLDLLPGTVRFTETDSGLLNVGACTVTMAPLSHTGPTNGYRINNGSGSVAYLSDHQQPSDGSLGVPEHVVELCKDVDVLIHDAQYDAAEFASRSDWGHSTPEFALAVAQQSGASRLVLFHHDPTHSDIWVRDTVERLQVMAGDQIEVMAACEGLVLKSD